MTYELVKELKDAGFPQAAAHYHEQSDYIENRRYNRPAHIYLGLDGKTAPDAERGLIAVPSLSQLIEACGEEFVALRNWVREQERYGNKAEEHDDPFIAESTRVEYGDEGTNSWISATGPTPEEAVARLWLALNKKL